MLDIQPIETAPKDGTPILSNEGYVLWERIYFLNQPTGKGKWIACFPDGGVFQCADNGPCECKPTHWTPTKIWDFTKTKPQ